MTASRSLAIALLFVAFSTSLLFAQSGRRTASGGNEATFELPTDARLWHNSPPLTLESLSGKGVIFYFFEEEDARIAANWPNLLGLSAQYEGKPLLFIGVNSGSDPRVLKRYLGRARIRWPVIHDLDRSLEKAMGVPRLTPDGEKFAVKLIDGSGTLQNGQGADFAGAAETALRGAAWRVDPAEVPQSLLGAWRSIELGDYGSAAKAVNRAAKAKKDDDLKSAAEKLLDAVEEEITESARQAQRLLTDGEDWSAYRELNSMVDRFDGYEFDLIKRAESKAKELAKSDAVKSQLAAAKLFSKAIATGSKGTTSARKRAKGLLQRVLSDYPGTEAAEKASDVLNSIGG